MRNETPMEFECRRKAEREEIAEMLERLDAVAHHMDLKWGMDLPSKVPEELRKRFYLQKKLADKAIFSEKYDDCIVQLPAMERAWWAIDKEATGEIHKAFEDDTVMEIMEKFPGAVVKEINSPPWD